MPKVSKKQKSPEQIQKEQEEALEKQKQNEAKLNLYSNVTDEYIQDAIQRGQTRFEAEYIDNNNDPSLKAFNLYPNKESLKLGMEKYCRHYELVTVFVHDVEAANSNYKNSQFHRDAAPLALLMSDGTDEDVIRQASRILKAYTAFEYNGDPTLLRELCKDALAITKGKTAFNLPQNTPEEFYKYQAFTHGFGTIVNIFSIDDKNYLEYKKNIKDDIAYSINSSTMLISRALENREISLSTDKIDPIVIQSRVNMKDESEDPVDYCLTGGTREKQYMGYCATKAWAQYAIDGEKTFRFEVPASSIGIKVGSSECYDPSFYNSLDKMIETEQGINDQLTIGNSTGKQTSIVVAEEFIDTQLSLLKSASYQTKFVENLPIKDGDLTRKSIFIEDKSLDELVEKQMNILNKNNPENKLDKSNVARVIMAQALGDPNKVVSVAVLSPTKDGFAFKAVPLEKDYTRATRISEKNHGYFRQFLHACGWKYPEEKLQEKQAIAVSSFKESNVIKNIEQKMNSQFKDNIKELSNTYERNDIVDLDKDIEISTSSRERISVKEANRLKTDIVKQDIKNDNPELSKNAEK